ncbi:hypothetical protein [Methylococcus sp. EFPC2]|uniref:hypothetical protein n=1 Tax=Methylococcus sp. EFPC2 TaxID=2812648 RepID=UPI001967EBA4|nr:hypothetical protein [Methylococcus sp. EFPC2]QSA96844.1 hypothetical protein JWZ97_16805 [Methylococcus sp. EFPC2]
MNINREKIAIFLRYGGDSDGWARMGTAEEKAVMSDGDWYGLSNLIQDYTLVKNGRASANFKARLEERIETSTRDPASLEALKRLIEQMA